MQHKIQLAYPKSNTLKQNMIIVQHILIKKYRVDFHGQKYAIWEFLEVHVVNMK